MAEFEVPDDIKSQLRLGSDDNVQKLLKRIVGHLENARRPVYAGHVLLDAGVTLRQLVLLFDILVHNDVARRASVEEVLKHFGTSDYHVVYVLQRKRPT